jgi:hypothetical protein
LRHSADDGSEVGCALCEGQNDEDSDRRLMVSGKMDAKCLYLIFWLSVDTLELFAAKKVPTDEL